jgi:hypothetical protein
MQKEDGPLIFAVERVSSGPELLPEDRRALQMRRESAHAANSPPLASPRKGRSFGCDEIPPHIYDGGGNQMKCQVCGMDVKDHPKADADGNCMVCGQKMKVERSERPETGKKVK